ncbi:hypothetical protein MY10362_008418 [Beauveria mimosiformis]
MQANPHALADGVYNTNSSSASQVEPLKGFFILIAAGKWASPWHPFFGPPHQIDSGTPSASVTMQQSILNPAKSWRSNRVPATSDEVLQTGRKRNQNLLSRIHQKLGVDSRSEEKPRRDVRHKQDAQDHQHDSTVRPGWEQAQAIPKTGKEQ